MIAGSMFLAGVLLVLGGIIHMARDMASWDRPKPSTRETVAVITVLAVGIGLVVAATALTGNLT